MRILFIGNSHTFFHDMPHTFAEICRRNGVQTEVTMLAHGGMGWDYHVKQPEVRFNIRFGQYDAVVLQHTAHPMGDLTVMAQAGKELIDWVAKHGPEATKMAGGISENKTAIADLKTLVGTLPEGATSTTVVAYITEAINALSIGDYAKTTEVTTAISTALESYYTKTQVDETFVKKTDIVMATDAEVDAMLTEVFGAQASV